jgi:hypothetical protein
VTIAQIAVAIAGFSGLIAAIRTASPDGWHPRDIWSMSWMLGASIGALVLALLPLWLRLLPWSDDFVYHACSALAFLYTGAFVAIMAWTGRRLTRRGYPPRIPLFPSAIVLLLGFSAVATGAAAAGLLPRLIVPVYVGALIALLVASVLVLAIFLMLLARLTIRSS